MQILKVQENLAQLDQRFKNNRLAEGREHLAERREHSARKLRTKNEQNSFSEAASLRKHELDALQ